MTLGEDWSVLRERYLSAAEPRVAEMLAEVFYAGALAALAQIQSGRLATDMFDEMVAYARAHNLTMPVLH